MAEKLKWSKQDIDPSGLTLRTLVKGQRSRPHRLALRAQGTSAAVLAARRTSMLTRVAEVEGVDLAEVDPEERAGVLMHMRQRVLSRAHDALIVSDGKVVQVGIRENEADKQLFGADYGERGKSHRAEWATAAPELGRLPLEVGMGLWVPEERLWYGAEEILVALPTAPIDLVEEKYPHTDVVQLPNN